MILIFYQVFFIVVLMINLKKKGGVLFEIDKGSVGKSLDFMNKTVKFTVCKS